MKIETHLEQLKESLEMIDESIKKGIEKRQRTIGFHTSAAASDLLEIYLHKKNLIDPGFNIKHEWLKADNKVKDKFSFEFERKSEILALMKKIEEKRNTLCYGKLQEKKIIQETLNDFNNLKTIFKELGINEF